METLEDKVLKAVDEVADQSEDKVTKMLVDLFKKSILEKYKTEFDKELSEGSVHRDNLNKAVDYCFSDACFIYRGMPINGISDDAKEKDIAIFRLRLGELKDNLQIVLEVCGVKVVR